MLEEYKVSVPTGDFFYLNEAKQMDTQLQRSFRPHWGLLLSKYFQKIPLEKWFVSFRPHWGLLLSKFLLSVIVAILGVVFPSPLGTSFI